MNVPRTMVSVELGGTTFQVRAAGIIRRAGHVLIHRMTLDDFWTLPGGRVEAGETAQATVGREIAEELGCEAVVGPLSYVVENMFEIGRRPMHEIGFYFEAELTGEFPFSATEICHRMVDGGAELEFRWVRPDEGTLMQYNFKPAPLIQRIATPATGPSHLVQQP